MVARITQVLTVLFVEVEDDFPLLAGYKGILPNVALQV